MRNVIVIKPDCDRVGKSVTKIVLDNGTEIVFINENEPSDCRTDRKTAAGFPFGAGAEKADPVPKPFRPPADNDILLEYLSRLLE